MTEIAFEARDRIAIIRVHGSRLNVYQRATHRQLCQAFLRFLRDDALHVAIITTSPGESWSAGDDVREFENPYGEEPDWSAILSSQVRDKPVIGAVRGYCLGQGFAHLLGLTDIRYATPAARFGFPEIRFGIGGAADLSGLTDEIPRTLARYLCLTGELLDAEDAARHGLVNAVVDEDALETTALETAARIAVHPLDGLRAEMSPVSRLIDTRNPYSRTAQFKSLWRIFESGGGARSVEASFHGTK